VPDTVWNAHGKMGFKFSTEDKEFYVYAESESVATKWVEHLSSAARLFHKQVEQGAKMGGGMGGLPALPEVRASPQPHPPCLVQPHAGWTPQPAATWTWTRPTAVHRRRRRRRHVQRDTRMQRDTQIELARAGYATGHVPLVVTLCGCFACVVPPQDDTPMPEHDELDKLVKEMLTAQGYKEQAAANIMMLADDHKWQLVKSYQQTQIAAAGDIREQPEVRRRAPGRAQCEEAARHHGLLAGCSGKRPHTQHGLLVGCDGTRPHRQHDCSACGSRRVAAVRVAVPRPSLTWRCACAARSAALVKYPQH
jgi:hypothetical protein